MTSTEVDRVNPLPTVRQANHITQTTAVEQARAVAEVAAAVRVAKEFPRDEARAYDRMRQACRQPALAERAFYSLPRAGGRIEGSTVHLARELARCWGNVDNGIRELSRDDERGESEIQAWAWDQEENNRVSRSFVVPHAIMATDKPTKTKYRKALTDLGDIVNNNNSVGARAVREVIKHVLPVAFVTEAEMLCAKTLQDGGGKTLPQQVADAIAHYRDTWNVTVEQLQDRVKRPSSKWTVQDLAGLRVLSGELTRGEKRVEEEFEANRVTAADVLGPSAQDIAEISEGR